jgi:porphobilinogen synthase
MQTNISLNSLIYPYFVRGGINRKESIKAFPGVFRFSIDRLLYDIEEIQNLGLNKILLFGIPDKKDIWGTDAFKENNIIALAIREIKKNFPDVTVITDVCLCGYTSHGHCGIIRGRMSEDRGQKTEVRRQKSEARCQKSEAIPPTSDLRHQTPDFIDNKATLETLARIALLHAEAGADYVAPSAMAKKQVKVIRSALDKNGYKETKILGYSAKFASGFYGPFRNAANSAPKFGDRKGYQLDFTTSKKALKEINADIKEGADIVMIKPAIAYLDIIKAAKQKFKFPLAAYNVSGEYTMVKAYTNRIAHSAKRMAREKDLVLEILTAIKRAGADLIITYHAKDVAKWLK